MNQILFCKKNDKLKKKYLKVYKLLFLGSSVILLFFSFFLFLKLYKNTQNELLSKKLNSVYSISTLYSQNSIVENQVQSSVPFVIGIIKIEKINVNYSILSNSSNDLLDISVCRFAGPLPNEIGNLCIAGHNYVDYKFFSRLNELNINDTIKIFDLKGNCMEYEIFNKYEISPIDTSCTNQNTNNQRIVTLVTCNNVNGKRLIIQAKESI